MPTQRRLVTFKLETVEEWFEIRDLSTSRHTESLLRSDRLHGPRTTNADSVYSNLALRALMGARVT